MLGCRMVTKRVGVQKTFYHIVIGSTSSLGSHFRKPQSLRFPEACHTWRSHECAEHRGMTKRCMSERSTKHDLFMLGVLTLYERRIKGINLERKLLTASDFLSSTGY
jgi:hypothetical protein